jgi:hypothetical protein|tara:strand:- start:1034 stop:1240 length:207 start_codon:yes stop_codon:yes gene_type:complete
MRRLFALCIMQVMAVMTVASATPREELQVGLFSRLEPSGIPPGWELLRVPSVGEETDYAFSKTRDASS